MKSFPGFSETKLLAVNQYDTLIGCDPETLVQFNRMIEPLKNKLILVYVSGRDLDEQIKDIELSGIPVPAYIINSVGTEIHRMPERLLLDAWRSHIEAGFSRAAIVEFMQAHFPDLEMQPDDGQTPLKISYFLKNADEDAVKQMQAKLNEHGFAVKVIYSYSLFLDLIPAAAGTGSALRFLIDTLSMMPSRVLVCGVNAADIDLFRHWYRGIVVENATQNLKKTTRHRAYFSKAGYAEGLLEGLEHYGFFELPAASKKPNLSNECLKRAVDSVRRNISPMGFTAASREDNPLNDESCNYWAVWSRDGVKTGLWCLSLNDPALTGCFRKTLEVLAKFQLESGQIPANVHLLTGKPEYGGLGDIASIDSVLWYVIGACRYAAHEKDRAFLTKAFPGLLRAMNWLRAHDSNNCGLLEIPESSDWMDLFPRSYNVLYDEVLWYLACRDFSTVASVMQYESTDYAALAERIKSKILRQFWPTARKLSAARESFTETQFSLGEAQYLLAQISPFGFSWRCDVYANLLAGLTGLLDERMMEQLFGFLFGVGANSPFPVKCYYPPIQSGASDWKDYFVTNFLNLPGHYHNGGIWPFIGGLWVRFLMKLGRTELAMQELNSLAESCRLGIHDEWEFNEWLHAETGRPMGKAHQAWSAAGYIAAYKSLHESRVEPDFEPLTPEMFANTTA